MWHYPEPQEQKDERQRLGICNKFLRLFYGVLLFFFLKNHQRGSKWCFAWELAFWFKQLWEDQIQVRLPLNPVFIIKKIYSEMRMKNSTLGILNYISILPLVLLVSSVTPLRAKSLSRDLSVQSQHLSHTLCCQSSSPICFSAITVYILPKSVSMTTRSVLRAHIQYPFYLWRC